MTKVYIDTNIFVDVFLIREPFVFDSGNLLELCVNKTISGFTSTTSVSNLYFILKKELAGKRTKEILSQLMTIVDVSLIDSSIIKEALQSDFSDFEDAIQYYCALQFGMDYIITRNEKDFRRSKIPVLSPKKFIDIISHK